MLDVLTGAGTDRLGDLLDGRGEGVALEAGDRTSRAIRFNENVLLLDYRRAEKVKKEVRL